MRSKCPRCDAYMAVPTPAARSCQRCGGYWIENEAIAKRTNDPEIAATLEAAAEEARPGRRRCPACGVAMGEIRFREIEIDLCKPCGAVFLDPGELRLLASGTGAKPTSTTSTTPAAHPGAAPLLDTRHEDRALQVASQLAGWLSMSGRWWL